ncbi:MAG: S49 family peptidase [Alphaproteobacteria bacterium]|nr:S49 family peptidase [Alphaproteobacteria bacterium]
MIRNFLSFLPAPLRPNIPVVPVVRLSGVIGAVTPFRQGLTLSGVERCLQRAFTVRHARAVAVVVNSPGGSPVQSRLIHARIRQLGAEHKLKVVVFVEDVAASGGYMIACAGNEIFCDPSSILGSIGVVGTGFGFAEAIKRFGIERRVYTAGEHKVMLDPFLPENPDEVARLKTIQREIHTFFISLVKDRRGARLTASDEVVFTGAWWAGTTAVALGLADGIGDLRSILRTRYGDRVQTPLFVPQAPRFSRLFGRSSVESTAGALSGLPDELIAALESRMMWGRFGL